jgi:uncharacterized cysteine cluster protein YcgN (CxxCxxCC family)
MAMSNLPQGLTSNSKRCSEAQTENYTSAYQRAVERSRTLLASSSCDICGICCGSQFADIDITSFAESGAGALAETGL